MRRLIAYVLTASLALLGASPARSAPQGSVPPPQPGLGKLEGSLVQVMRENLARGPEQAKKSVRITIALRRSLSREQRRMLEARGAKVEIVAPWAVEALIPYEKLEAVASLGFVKIIHLPLKPLKLATVHDPTNIEWLGTWPSQGLGAKVAVFDNFNVDPQTPRILGCDVSYRSYVPPAEVERDRHGNAAAEVICKMAPRVKLLLINYSTIPQFWQALNDVIDRDGVDVISHSVVWTSCFDFFDGSSDASKAVAGKVGNRVLFAQAAGNDARRHWFGTFAATRTAEFYSGFTGTRFSHALGLTPREKFRAWLVWNDPSQQLIMLVGRERVPGSGVIDWTVPAPSPSNGRLDTCQWLEHEGAGQVFIGVRNDSPVPRRVSFHLHVISGVGSTESFVPERSLTGWPTVLENFITVGAIDTDSVLRPYSSQGPTGDGRTKPDICSYMPVYSETYRDPVEGTSFSTPQVAGTAALLKSMNASLSGRDLKMRLMQSALKASVPSNQCGDGILNPRAARQLAWREWQILASHRPSIGFTTSIGP